MTMKVYLLIGSIALLIGSATPGHCDAAASVQAYLTNLEGITSYDVQLRSESFVYEQDTKNPATKPMDSLVWTNRDVFAVNLGRRVEKSIGDDEGYTVRVVNWSKDALKARQLKLDKAAVIPDCDYYNLLNPRVGSFFFADLLRHAASKLRVLGPLPTDESAIGFEISNPGLSSEFVKVWLDSSHGHMPKRMEWYNTKPGAFAAILGQVLQVQEFAYVSDRSWVPIKATIDLNTPISIGAAVVRPTLGWILTLHPTDCRWNEVASDRLFLPDSLPFVNYEEDVWKCYYSPAILRAYRSSDREWSKAVLQRRMRTAIVLLVLGVAGIVPGAFAYRLYRRRSSS